MTVPQTQPEDWLKQPRGLTPPDMLRLALEKGSDLGVLDKLMAMQAQWDARNARRAFDRAIAAAKAKIGPITKSREVTYGHTRYKHETMSDIDDATREPLAEQGLSYRFRTENTDRGVKVTCILAHQEGHIEETGLAAAVDTSGSKNALQALGSAITYLQRYTLKSALGLAAAYDDDATSVKAPTKIIKPAPNVLMHDPETGEITDPAPVSAARDAAAAGAASSAAAAAPGSEAPDGVGAGAVSSAEITLQRVSDLTMDEADAYLAEAAKDGMAKLEDAWADLTHEQKRILKVALERRHKPIAKQADEWAAIVPRLKQMGTEVAETTEESDDEQR